MRRATPQRWIEVDHGLLICVSWNGQLVRRIVKYLDIFFMFILVEFSIVELV